MVATEPTFYKRDGPLFPPDDPDILSYIGRVSGRIHAQRGKWLPEERAFALYTRIGRYTPHPDLKLTICGLNSEAVFPVHTGDIAPCGKCWSGHQSASKYLMSEYWGRSVIVPGKEDG